MTPGAAVAQSAPTDRIDAIEKQIRNLQNELQQLKSDLGEAKQQLRQSRAETQRSKDEARQAQQAAEQARQDALKAATAQSQATQAAAQAQAAAAAPPPAPVAAAEGVKVGFPGGRPTISSSDGSISFAIGNQTQFDYGTYFQNPLPTTQFPHLNYGVNLRRERIFFVAKYDDWTLNVAPDFGGSPDGNQSSQFLYEANLNFTGIKPVTATIGYFKPWFSLYDSQSSNDFLLMERPSIIEIARNVAAGDARASAGLKANQDQWFASGYFTGSPYGAQTSSLLNGEQMSMVGRAAGRPYYDEDWNIHLDLSGEYVFKPAINLTGTTPNVNQHTFNLQDRPEDRAADMNRLISTGNLSINTVGVYGGETGISWRNFLVQGGYYHIGEDQQKLTSQPAPHLDFHGGYVEGGWVLTGEPIRYSTGAAAFARPKVASPFGFTEDGFETGPGAWEIGARWSVMNLNSHVTPGVSQSVTGGVFGGLQQIFGVALSWYPNDWVRFYLQFQYSQIDKLNSAGTAQIGQHYETLAGRMQIAF
jgi:phosphate-selective porin OprO/OprP